MENLQGAMCQVRGGIVKHENFSTVQETLPSKTTCHSLLAIRCSLLAIRRSPLANRHSLSFRLGMGDSSSHFPVPRPTTFVPLKVSAQVFVINYGLKPVAWLVSFGWLTHFETRRKAGKIGTFRTHSCFVFKRSELC